MFLYIYSATFVFVERIRFSKAFHQQKVPACPPGTYRKRALMTSLRSYHGHVHVNDSQNVERVSNQRQPAGSSCALAFGSCVEAADTVGQKGTSIDREVVLGNEGGWQETNLRNKAVYVRTSYIFSCITYSYGSSLASLPPPSAWASPSLPPSLPPPFISMVKLLLRLARTCRSGVRCLLLCRLHHAPIV